MLNLLLGVSDHFRGGHQLYLGGGGVIMESLCGTDPQSRIQQSKTGAL